MITQFDPDLTPKVLETSETSETEDIYSGYLRLYNTINRVYFMDCSSEIIILLVGGDKKTQSDDIKTAKSLAKEYEDGKTD